MNIKEWKAIHRSLARIHYKLEKEDEPLYGFPAKKYIRQALYCVDDKVAAIEQEKRRSKEG